MERVFFITSIIPVYPRFWIVPFVSSLRAFLASKVSPVGDFRLVSPLRGADAVPSLTKDDLPEPLRLWTTVRSRPAALGSPVLVLGPPPALHLFCWQEQGLVLVLGPVCRAGQALRARRVCVKGVGLAAGQE